MSNDITIKNDLPAEIIALQHTTLDQAMTLCERAHGVAIPAAVVDEAGCRSALATANTLYGQINDLSKELEARRLEEGRKISAVKTRLDEAVKAAVKPLEDQRQKLGMKIAGATRDLQAIVDRKRREAEEEARRRQAEVLAQQEAQRKAAEAAAAATAKGDDPLPDVVAAAAAPLPLVDDVPAPYVPPAPTSAVRMVTETTIEVEDLAKIPREIGGVSLWTLDQAACLKLAKAGVTVPGIRVVKTEKTAAKGRGGAFAV